MPNALEQRLVRGEAALVEEAEVDAGLLDLLDVRLAECHGVEVLVLDDQVRRVDAELVELPPQLPAEDIVADDADHLDRLGLSAARFATTLEAPPSE